LFPNTELAIIPHGEQSDFLSIFGEDKKEIFRDIPTLVQSKSIPTDIINWGINYTLNSCYIGLNSATAIRLKEIKSRLNKGIFIVFSKISSFLSTIFTAFDKQIAAQQYSLLIDYKDFSGTYSLIHIANGPYYAGRLTGSSAALPDDGLLDVALIKSAGPLKTMWSLRRYARGKKPSNCMTIQAKKISIESEKQMCIQLDNEYIRDNNISLNIVPQAVNVVVLDGLSYQKQ
jgi:diacylglycerol kinase family enzyme